MSSVRFKTKLITEFHKRLINKEWLERFGRALLEEFEALRGQDVVVGLEPERHVHYSRGAHKLEGYRFLLEFSTTSCPTDFDALPSMLELDPTGDNPDFELSKQSDRYLLRTPRLESMLVQSGQVLEFTSGSRPDPRVKDILDFRSFRPTILPLKMDGDVLQVLMADVTELLLLPEVMTSKEQVVQPVLVSQAEFDKIGEEVYGPTWILENIMVLMENLAPRLVDSFDYGEIPNFPNPQKMRNVSRNFPFFIELRSDDYPSPGFRLKHEFCSMKKHMTSVQIHPHLGSARTTVSDTGFALFRPKAKEWERLVSLAEREEVWQPEYARPQGWPEFWTLEWWNPPVYRIMQGVSPPAGPFWELYMEILAVAGFELVFIRKPQLGLFRPLAVIVEESSS